MYHIYGIKNCSTVKKALTWLDQQNVSYTFHDYKKEGVGQQQLQDWCQILGWKSLLNTKGTTYRRLSEEQRAVTTQTQAIALMQEYPSAIKRPLLKTPTGQLLLGFDENVYAGFIK